VAIAACYFLGAAKVSADPPPQCQDCDCKMCFAWVNGSDSYAQGMQSQGATPLKILYGTPIQASACPNPPQSPTPTNPFEYVDRYQYQNPAFTCTDNPNSRLMREADVSSAGTAIAWDIIRQICIPAQGQ
jgi:hypothetical protein